MLRLELESIILDPMKFKIRAFFRVSRFWNQESKLLHKMWRKLFLTFIFSLQKKQLWNMLVYRACYKRNTGSQQAI
jgi:hypothetical protein